MDWFLIALISAFCLASADAAQKHLFLNYTSLELLIVRFGISGILLLPLFFINPMPPLEKGFILWMGLMVPLELLAMWLYVTAVRDSPLHLTVPYLAFTPVINILTGYLILDESVSLLGATGILVVVLGTYLLNTDTEHTHWLDPFKAVFKETGSRKMLMAAVVYSLTSVGSKAAMQYTTPEIFGPTYFVVIGFAIIVIALLYNPASLKVLTHSYASHILVAGLMAAMVVTHFIAIAKVEVAYFITVKRTSLLFGIIFGALFFKEPRLAKNLSAGVLMVTGVLFILVTE
ncbi:MAG: DMT family transporter [Gammaproteobacteria bacterium]|nr:DMT family transporter [Gammaproteobacteria bacterium]